MVTIICRCQQSFDGVAMVVAETEKDGLIAHDTIIEFEYILY